jgi:hypothetical protein
MARHSQSLSQELCERLSIGVLARSCPLPLVREVLEKTGRQSQRQRDLGAEVVVYYVMALGLFMTASYEEVLRCLREGLHWLGGSLGRASTKGALSIARQRLGEEPMRLLYQRCVRPLGHAAMPGSHFRRWRRVALDGSTLALQDTEQNEAAFGRPQGGRGEAAWPMLRFTALCEVGTHVILAALPGPCKNSEKELSASLLSELNPDMLCLADRLFFGYSLWKQAAATGAALLWRVKKHIQLPVRQELPDGSYLSEIYPKTKARRRQKEGIVVRVIEYELQGVEDAEPLYRLVTNLLDPLEAPAGELAEQYPQRWELEGSFDEIKTHLREGRKVLRSKLPELVRQEFWGLLLAHYAVRSLMVEAAQRRGRDPDEVSFVHAVRVMRRKVTGAALSFSP